jgi:periplasmic divalent cation tolerance protein
MGMDTSMAYRLVMVTAPSESDARMLAAGLVEAELAACVSIVPGLTSIYRWKGEVQTEAEHLLLIKTTAEALPLVETWVLENHPYDVPECLAIVPHALNTRYAQWLGNQVTTTPEQ